MMKNMNENFFQNIFESMPDGMWITDSQHRIIYANRAMAGIAGVGVDQIVGQSVLDGFSDPTLWFFRDHYHAAVNALKPQKILLSGCYARRAVNLAVRLADAFA
jgi:PAS domain-containing protein